MRMLINLNNETRTVAPAERFDWLEDVDEVVSEE